MLGKEWAEEPNAPYQIDIARAREDPKRKVFVKALNELHIVYAKVMTLQTKASEYEKFCLRLYWHIAYNWNHEPNTTGFKDKLSDSELFEIVEAYFKICRKYQLPLFEDPYYFLPEQRRRQVKLEGDMLRRSTDYSDSDTRVSILEALA